jgi:predicted NBD/HSP70 family sugar kinase
MLPSWDAVDVPGVLQRLLEAPVLVDKDVNLMALGEHRTNWRTVRDMLFVNVASSIGSGIIADGELRRGAQGAAGDIGHVAVPNARDVLCRCGNVGCLEAVASGNAIAAGLRARGLTANDTSDVIALIQSGEVATSQAVRQAGREIGSVIAACVSMLNPSLIVVGGVIANASEHLIAGIRELVYQRSLPLATEHLRIVNSRNWSQVGVIGASAMAVEHVLSPRAIDALVP